MRILKELSCILYCNIVRTDIQRNSNLNVGFGLLVYIINKKIGDKKKLSPCKNCSLKVDIENHQKKIYSNVSTQARIN